MPTVTSSAITRIDFDDLTHRLEVTFKHGNSYTYYAVPRSVYERFINAPSHGRFFAEYIRDRYSSYTVS